MDPNRFVTLKYREYPPLFSFVDLGSKKLDDKESKVLISHIPKVDALEFSKIIDERGPLSFDEVGYALHEFMRNLSTK